MAKRSSSSSKPSKKKAVIPCNGCRTAVKTLVDYIDQDDNVWNLCAKCAVCAYCHQELGANSGNLCNGIMVVDKAHTQFACRSESRMKGCTARCWQCRKFIHLATDGVWDHDRASPRCLQCSGGGCSGCGRNRRIGGILFMLPGNACGCDQCAIECLCRKCEYGHRIGVSCQQDWEALGISCNHCEDGDCSLICTRVRTPFRK